jgi:hypothetical protein
MAASQTRARSRGIPAAEMMGVRTAIPDERSVFGLPVVSAAGNIEIRQREINLPFRFRAAPQGNNREAEQSGVEEQESPAEAGERC